MRFICPLMLTVALVRGAGGQEITSEFRAMVDKVVRTPTPASNFRLYTEGPKHWDWLVQSYVSEGGSGRARILYAIHTPSGNYSPLLPLAIQEKSASIRAMAAAYVAHMESPKKASWRLEAIEALRRDKSISVRRSLAGHLSWSRDGLALLRPMLKDRDPVVRIEAAVTLGRQGDRSMIPLLFGVLDRQQEYTNRHRVAGEPDVETTIASFGSLVLSPARKALKSSSSEKRARTLNVLRLAGLKVFANHVPDPADKGISADTLFGFGKSFLVDRSPQVRIRAIDLLVVDQRRSAIRLLVGALRDPDKSVRDHAALRLEHGSDPAYGNVWLEGQQALKKTQKSSAFGRVLQ